MKSVLYTLATMLMASVIAASTLAAADLQWSGTHRLRYESLHNGPRPNASASDEILVSRLLASLTFETDSLSGQLELQDSRAWLHSASTPLGTDDVNSLEPLQAWIGWAGGEELPLQIRAGIMTKEWRTRRLLARNRYRNTINSFQGIDANWLNEDWTLNVFSLSAMDRRPADRSGLESNQAALDRPASGQRLYGLEFRPKSMGDWSVYALQIKEDDPPKNDSPQRNFSTVGGEWRWQSDSSGWFNAGELAAQLGNTTDLTEPEPKTIDHRAWFGHLEIGHTLERQAPITVVASIDYATGDKPDEQTYQRFDTLFGARRFEYGPSGIYAAEARSNLLSPELRTVIKPTPSVEWMTAWRGFWLEQPTDTQTGTNYRQSGGKLDRHVGQQLETRLRWTVDSRLQLETGAAWLDKGSVLKGEDFAQDGDSIYLYISTTLRW